MISASDLAALVANLRQAYDAQMRSYGPASFSQHYRGAQYLFGPDMGKRRAFQPGQTVMPWPITGAYAALADSHSGYAPKKFADHPLDVGIVIAVGVRSMASTLFLVYFSNGDVRPYPIKWLCPDEPIIKANAEVEEMYLASMGGPGMPGEESSNPYFTQVPNTADQKQAEDTYVDPFAAEGQ